MTESDTAWLHFTMLLASELGDSGFARYFVKDDLSTLWFWANLVVTLPLFYVEGSLPYQFFLHVLSWMVAGILTLVLKTVHCKRCQFLDLLFSNDNMYGPISCSLGGVVQYTSAIICFMTRGACRCARLPYSVQAVSFAVGVPIVNHISVWLTFRLLFATWLLFWLVVRISHMYLGKRNLSGRRHFSLRMRSAEGLCKINDARRLLQENLFYTFSGAPCMPFDHLCATIHSDRNLYRVRSRCAAVFKPIFRAARVIIYVTVCVAVCLLICRSHPLREVDSVYCELRNTILSVCVPAVLILLPKQFIANSVDVTAYIYERMYDFVCGDRTSFQDMQRELQNQIDNRNHQHGLA